MRSRYWVCVAICSAPRVYHVYFVYSDDVVVIVGIWGATRRTTPRFADRIASTKAALAKADEATTKSRL